MIFSDLLKTCRASIVSKAAITALSVVGATTLSATGVYGDITPSNASLDVAGDRDELTVDFGTVGLRHDPAFDFAIANLSGGKETARLKFVGVADGSDISPVFRLVEIKALRSGEKSVPLKSFSAMAAGNARRLRIEFDASLLGTHTANYLLSFTDKTGNDQTLSLHVTGQVTAEGFPDIPDLIYDPDTGEVTLDSSQTAPLIGYVLHTAGGLFEESYQPFFPTAGQGGAGVAATMTDTDLGEVVLPPGQSKRESIGEVFPMGMDYLALDRFVAKRKAQFGDKLGSLTSKPFDLVVVGEDPPQAPSGGWSLATWLIALTGLIVCGLGMMWRTKRGQS